ncbi:MULTISPECIES: hypothetical protein [Bradyrhizobium]|nr:hypothetical protein [Bradyrhizobium zhengyangense]MCG2645725.1 hypothetical protein [Bradyrhizobium zhengyangense]
MPNMKTGVCIAFDAVARNKSDHDHRELRKAMRGIERDCSDFANRQ